MSIERNKNLAKLDRREFLKHASLGAAGAGMAMAGSRSLLAAEEKPASGGPKSAVVRITNDQAMASGKPDAAIVKKMLEKGIVDLTGKPSPAEAWKSIVKPEDVVGLKINGLGAPNVFTTPELTWAVVDGVKSAGVKEENIIIFDRFKNHVTLSGFEFNEGPTGVKCVFIDPQTGYDKEVFYQSSAQMESSQALAEYLVSSVRALEEKGQDASTLKAQMPRIKQAGSDHAAQEAIKKELAEKFNIDFSKMPTPDDKSYFPLVLTKKITALINLPCLKDHGIAGVTVCLKNLAFGLVDNTPRFHPSYCDPMIADVCANPVVKSKLRLNICDALRACYNGGPGAMNPAFRWNDNSILLSFDPVAMDQMALELIDAKRQENGTPLITGTERVKHIASSARLGLGTNEKDRIELRNLTA